MAQQPLRIALTISGAVSLGAYEAGALAALLSAIRPLNRGDDPVVRIDAIGGASAGSITGLLAAHCLVEGVDPFDVMHTAWVEHGSLAELRARDTSAPLGTTAVEAMARELLSGRGAGADRQHGPVQLSMALAALRGLEYEIRGLTSSAPVHATTYLDWKNAEIVAGGPTQELLEYALASGANALGFAPRGIDRLADRDEYEANGVTNFPSTGRYWYTDGGTIDNEPVGRTLDLVARLDEDGQAANRVLLLVHPHPTSAPRGTDWAGTQTPAWLQTLLRAQRIQTTQSSYEDLLRVEKTNTRIRWTAGLQDTLATQIRALPEAQQAAFRDALAAFLGGVDADRARLGAGTATLPATAAPSLDDVLGAALQRSAGVIGKHEVGIDVISPEVLPEARTTPVEQLLAGEFLFHFGGFVDRTLRQSDFDLGYRSVTTWMAAGGLTRHGLDPASNHAALDVVHARYSPPALDPRVAATTLGSLPWGERLGLLRVLAHLVRVVIHDLRR